MKELVKEFIIILAIAIGLAIATVILFYFDFKFISGLICSPVLLFYLAAYASGGELYRTYKSEKERIQRDEEWHKEQLVRDVMES